jgi:hypothetical protein
MAGKVTIIRSFVQQLIEAESPWVDDNGKLKLGYGPKVLAALNEEFDDIKFTNTDLANYKTSAKKDGPPTELLALAKKNKQKRSTPFHEENWCKRCVFFLKEIMTMEINVETKHMRALFFGTQTIFSYTKTGKLCFDNIFVVDALREMARGCNMVVGNIKDPAKAIQKVKDWLTYYDKKRKMKEIKAGKVSPEALRKRVNYFYRPDGGWPISIRRVVLIMDSGESKNYETTFLNLTKKYPNLYIIKMCKINPAGFHIMRAYQGRIDIVDNNEIDKLMNLSHKDRHVALLDEKKVLSTIFK